MFPARSVPRPFSQVTLFFRNRNSTPRVFCATTSSFRRSIWCEVEPKPVDADAVLVRVQPGELVVLGRLQQRLRRNAADVHARAAERRRRFDADGVQAELGGPDCCDVATGTAADHDDVGGLAAQAASAFGGGWEDSRRSKK